MRFFGILILNIFLLPTFTDTWKNDRKPKIFGSKLSKKVLSTEYPKVRKKIIFHHNSFRSRVKPEAADMLLMKWHVMAARAAQLWADSCPLLNHDSLKGRWIRNFGSCGQNIFISTQKVPWFFAIQTWFLEKNLFTYGSKNNSIYEVGHYTQMVWSATHRVGCGFAECRLGSKTFYEYVCNYCPIGNYLDRLGRPYKKGRACSQCPNNCKNSKFCLNNCRFVDSWANCKQLHKSWPSWLCHTTHTAKGLDRLQNCKATCKCKGKIF